MKWVGAWGSRWVAGVSKVYNNGTKPHSIRLRFAHITRILPICVVVDFKSFLYKLNKQIIWNHCNLILQMEFGWTGWHKMRKTITVVVAAAAAATAAAEMTTTMTTTKTITTTATTVTAPTTTEDDNSNGDGNLTASAKAEIFYQEKWARHKNKRKSNFCELNYARIFEIYTLS